jgi:hypothetical protein
MAIQTLYAGFMSSDPAYEIQRTNNFYITLDLSAFGAADAGLMSLACETTGLPNSNTDPLEAPYGNSVVKVAGKTTFDDISITIKDFIEKDIEAVLMKWRYAVYNPETGKVGWAANYKREARITLYAPNGTCERTWMATGVWPTGIELGDMDYSSSDLRKITMTLSVDHAQVVHNDRNVSAKIYGTKGYLGDTPTYFQESGSGADNYKDSWV